MGLATNGIIPFGENKIRSQEHMLGFATCLYDYVLVRKDICDYWLLSY